MSIGADSESRQMIADSRPLERSITLIPLAYVAVIGPMAQLLPSGLFVTAERQRVGNGVLKLRIVYVAAIGYPTKSFEEEGAIGGHQRILH